MEPFNQFALILISTVFVNNYVLTQFLGLCPFMGASRKPEMALGMSLATGFVLTLSSCASYLVFKYLLVPLEIEYLKTISFIVIIASMVASTEIIMYRLQPALYQMLGIYLPLITTNCAVLGVALLNTASTETLLEAAIYGLGAALGFSIVLMLFSGIRERVELADIPQSFRGAPIAFIIAGIMSIAFMGFAGIA